MKMTTSGTEINKNHRGASVNKTAEMTKMALMVAMNCVSAYIIIPLPFSLSPLALQTMIVNLTGYVLNAKQAFITRKEGEPHKKGSLGVEHASKEALERALKDLHEVDPQKSDLTETEYRKLGLAGGSGSRKLREQVGIKLSVGYGNSKQFYNRLHTFGVSLDELKQAVEEIENGK